MIGVAGKNCPGPIELLKQHDAYKLMRPRCRSEGELELGAPGKTGREAVGAADKKANGRAVLPAPCTQQPREARTVETLAPFVENDDDGPFGNDIGECNRFLKSAPLGIVGATFANFNAWLNRETSSRSTMYFPPTCSRR